MIQKTDRGFKFSSGRSFNANQHYIGITENPNGDFEIAEGYDSSITLKDKDGEYLYDEPESELTTDEKIELATYMINIWTKYKEQSKQ